MGPIPRPLPKSTLAMPLRYKCACAKTMASAIYSHDPAYYLASTRLFSWSVHDAIPRASSAPHDKSVNFFSAPLFVSSEVPIGGII